MERPFDIQLEKLKTKLYKMCSLVDEQVEFAIKSLEKVDPELANIVLKRDSKIDKYDDKIERICQKLFALNQPVAMDLRYVMSALKINANLERVGDLSVNIARLSLEISEPVEIYSKINFGEISYLTKFMIKNAIDSFIRIDAELARQVLSTDDKLDELVRTAAGSIIDEMKRDGNFVEQGLKIYSVLQEMERLGDHATNISEEVYFIVKAQSIKHRSDSFDNVDE
ncbi:MAG: phosphate signaling complex protein PhoU [Ignavibacteriaceae bacterium]|jgi:phosphate transport system protein|nr:phosphate signaling complex protein PhoU [Ignavibacteriaceae bacterium]